MLKRECIMKKFIFIFSFLIACPQYGKAMMQQSNVILTHPIFLHPETIIAENNLDTIQGALDILEQYQELQNIRIQSQMHVLKNKQNAIEKIETISKQAQEQPVGLKEFDPLFNDQNLLSLIRTPLSIQVMQYLLASQKYLLHYDTLSFREKNQILHHIWNLLPYQIPLINDLRKYDLKNLNEMAALLPIFYDKVWNAHKFIITSDLLNNLKDAQVDYTQHLNELHNLQAFNEQLMHTKNQYKHAIEEINHLKKRHDKKLQKKSAKKTVQEPAMHVPELSKKEKAALLIAEQRAEQSKRDKERQAILRKEQEDLTIKNASVTTPAQTEVKKASKASGVKQKNKNKIDKPIIDEDLDYLDSIIAQMPPVQNVNAPTVISSQHHDLKNYIEQLDKEIAEQQAKDLERKKRLEQITMQQTFDAKESV